MKRSQMLKLLYEAVDKSLQETTVDNLVDVILTAAEKNGMMPPLNGYETEYTLDAEYNEIPYHVDKYTWSPEDEEKG